MFRKQSIFAVLTGLGAASASAQITIPTVPIGNPGNAADPTTGYGSVAYTYNIGQTEVTNAQYAAFLNAKAVPWDVRELYNTNMAGPYGGITRSYSAGSYFYEPHSGRENDPVNFVSFWDAVRFANWLHNGQGTGNTETGAYRLELYITNPENIARDAGWRWAVTSENEWYKAAYHQPASAGGDVDNYWLYPTSSNEWPTPGYVFLGGQANYSTYIPGTTPVGSYAANYYGTFDMAGNVREWTEAGIGSANRGLRGGAWGSIYVFLRADNRFIGPWSVENNLNGIRVSRVAESPVSISGTIVLEDYNPVQGGQDVVLDLVRDGIVIESQTVMLDHLGRFSTATTKTGSVTIRAKVSHWLAKNLGTYTLTGAVTGVNGTLINGDVDGDNSVTVFDYAVVSDYFDMSPWDAGWAVIGSNGFAPVDADLDGDEAITVFDYAILSDNFDKSGD